MYAVCAHKCVGRAKHPSSDFPAEGARIMCTNTYIYVYILKVQIYILHYFRYSSVW